MKKDVKNYSYKITNENDYNLILKTCNEYARVYNFFSERYCGIKNIVNTGSLSNTRNLIRNNLYKDDQFKRDIKLGVIFWRCALEDATSNIRSMWSNLFNKIRRKMYKNENLNDEQKHLINYLFLNKEELEKILNCLHPQIPNNFSGKVSNTEFELACNTLRRYIRKYKPNKSKNTQCRSFTLESGSYDYIEKDGILHIILPVLKKRTRVILPLKSNTRFTGNIRVVLDKDRKRVITHKCIESKTSDSVPESKKEIGVDKGMKKLISTSTKNKYGIETEKIAKEKSEWETKILKGRNIHKNAYYKALENKNYKKAERILKCNLGKKKFNKKELKYKEHLKSEINHELRTFFMKEKPETIVLEDLSFASWTRPMKSKVKYYLSSWCKGYLDERLEYLAEYFNCKVIYINPAYTSQVCSFCGHLDKNSRKGEKFKCSNCGKEIDADINASINILKRKDDKRITLYTPYNKVKEILIQ